ncbi:OLC1v1032396C1 [Oldenlandia corymbosa var. corymbosa]|uniref:OLC1v1032396C1 n=1 Tax=Oldenlandia corymbosa var. corymbosa TaxID=529605 RepID=A0AAV1CLL9_OLDCO|nr:OLC1v1032396C1 [Oldenlandia corymbosa var. corymbosa]
MTSVFPPPNNPILRQADDARNKVLIIGATGFIGRFIIQASLDSGLPTYILSRRPAFDGDDHPKAQAIKAFQDQGAIILHGSINDDQALLEKMLKENEIDIVISVVGGGNLLDQLTLIRAIKTAGTKIKRFLPSEFGHDVDRADPVEPGLRMYKEKRKVRRLTEELGIPYTYICCNSIASWPYYDNTHPSDVLPPLHHFQIYGDGNIKAYFVAGVDIGRLTIKAASDVRTVNKTVHFRPKCNFLSMNELASLWENKIGRTLPRVTVSENDLLAAAQENVIPQSIVAAFTHDIFIKGCQINFSVDEPHEVEISSLYPDETFRTMDECFDEFAAKIEDKCPIEASPVMKNVT